jgi:hypothetical protein
MIKRKVFCTCRRLHEFEGGPGLYWKGCPCGRKVTMLIKPFTRFSLLEVDP